MHFIIIIHIEYFKDNTMYLIGGITLHNRDIKIDKNIQRWEEKIIQIFPNAVPNRCIWYDEIDILNILFSLCDKNLNNIFYPNGEVYSLMGIDFSKEDKCLELITEKSIDLIKPINLSFHYFDEAYEWAYFRIETDNLDQTTVYDFKSSDKEELIINGKYQSINSFLQKSSFLIFPKDSSFNIYYDRSLNELTCDEFEKKIEDYMPKG